MIKIIKLDDIKVIETKIRWSVSHYEIPVFLRYSCNFSSSVSCSNCYLTLFYYAEDDLHQLYIGCNHLKLLRFDETILKSYKFQYVTCGQEVTIKDIHRHSLAHFSF